MLAEDPTLAAKKAAIQLEPSWKEILATEFDKPYFWKLVDFIKEEKKEGKILYPPGPLIFNAFTLTPFDKVKVVILGQDPYHNPGEAEGLSFSVPKGVRIPPSLLNIYKEMQADIGTTIPSHGHLGKWAAQGVLLLNAILTVRKGEAASHQRNGWEQFTDAVISALNHHKQHLVFMLWGKYAKNKGAKIDTQKHLVLEAAHPSPLAGNAFFGCRHFSKTNTYLSQHHNTNIDWQID